MGETGTRAGHEPTITRDVPSWRAVGIAAVCFLSVLAAASACAPYVPGFDDLEHLHDAERWRQSGQLTTDGLFVRVPLWPMLVGSLGLVFGVQGGALLLQCASVLGAFALYHFHHRERGEVGGVAFAAPLLVWSASPQLALYARQLVNELFVGMLALAVVAMTWRPSAWRCLIAGVATGAAFGVKLAAVVIGLPGLVWIVRSGRPRAQRLRFAALFALGFALVAAPLYGLHQLQRAPAPFDNTSAYNLSAYSPEEWAALGTPNERRERGLAAWRAELAAAPGAAAIGVATRLGAWVARPSTADFSLYYAGYPHAWIQALDTLVFFGLVSLALLGTDRRSWPVWLAPLALALAASLGHHVPASPKATFLFPCVLLAPLGLASLSRPRAQRAASKT